MMSLHRPMHSSQMYTVGPAISFFTSFWDLPQKEQLRLPPVGLSSRFRSMRLWSPLSILLVHGLRHLLRRQRRVLLVGEDVVDQAVFLGLARAHEVIALGVVVDAVERLAGVLGQELVQ